MKDKVVTVSIEAETGGQVLAVQDATITNAVNAIPTIELACAPSEPNYSYDNLIPNVIKPHISEFSDMYRDLSEKAEGLDTTGSVDIKIDGDDHDSLLLNNWILAGVGLSSASATGAPHLSVILQHPICKLTKVGSVYETPKSDVAKALNGALKGAGNILDVMSAVYKCVKNAEYWPSPEPYSALAPEFRQMLGTGEFDPKKYLTWKGGNGLFLSGNGKGNSKGRMAQAIGRMILGSTGGSSTWDVLLASAGEILASVTQDESCNYTQDQLVIEPTQPWKSSSFTLNEDRCASTDLQGMDPLRISGVMARKLGPYAMAPNQAFLRNGNKLKKDPVSDILYAPKNAGVTAANGRIVKVNPPSVLDAAFRRDAPYGNTVAQGIADLDKFRTDGFNEAIGKYCKAVYETSAASMVRAKAQMALSFRVGGKLLVPGNTCKFVSDGKDIYYGYMQQIVHHLSTGGGNSTHVLMSYVRPGPGFMVNGQEAIKAGSPNAAYE